MLMKKEILIGLLFFLVFLEINQFVISQEDSFVSKPELPSEYQNPKTETITCMFGKDSNEKEDCYNSFTYGKAETRPEKSVCYAA